MKELKYSFILSKWHTISEEADWDALNHGENDRLIHNVPRWSDTLWINLPANTANFKSVSNHFGTHLCIKGLSLEKKVVGKIFETCQKDYQISPALSPPFDKVCWIMVVFRKDTMGRLKVISFHSLCTLYFSHKWKVHKLGIILIYIVSILLNY